MVTEGIDDEDDFKFIVIYFAHFNKLIVQLVNGVEHMAEWGDGRVEMSVEGFSYDMNLGVKALELVTRAQHFIHGMGG